jgi:hypothetical protein
MAQEDPGLDFALALEALPTVAASQERKKLRRSVGRLDTAFLMLAAITTLSEVRPAQSFPMRRASAMIGP